MQTPKIRRKQGPEAIIQADIIAYMVTRGWLVKETHGNLYQSGFPDLYCTHSQYGIRWIECKQETGYCFTPAQLEWFPKFTANGTGIWILCAATESEYLKLWHPPNWWVYQLTKNPRTANHLCANPDQTLPALSTKPVTLP